MPSSEAKKYYFGFDRGFPLFSPSKSKDYLLKCERIQISDAWSFLNYTIRVSRDGNTNHPLNQGQQKFLLDLLEQAEYFYETAQNAPIKSQPLLYYYSFMNLVKIVINLDKYQGNGKRHVHGISESIAANSKLSSVEIKLWNSSGGDISNSEYLIRLLEDPPLSYVNPRGGRGGGRCSVKMIDLMRDCVGIHRTFCEIYHKQEHFHRLSEFELFSQNRKLYFYALIEKCNDTVMSGLLAKGYNIIKVDDLTYLWEIDTSVRTTANPTIAEMHTLSKKMRNLGLWSYSDGDEYELFVSPTALRMSSPSIIYHAMFFYGSITRYHPDLFDSILSAKEYWMVSEFLRTQPQQFLSHMLSLINGAEVLFSMRV